MAKKNLILLSYGREAEYFRAVFCILSFLAWSGENRKKVRIIIYSDYPIFFKGYLEDPDIDYFLLTSDLLKKMRGGTDFLHRIKVAVIDLTFKRFPDEDLLFIDSDTFFISESKDLLDEFRKGHSFMHKMEYTLKEGLDIFASYDQPEFPKAFIRYISSRNFTIGNTIENFTESDYSWNSGVLGLSKDFAVYMPDVIRLTDRFYENSQWFISEQLAFSLILQRKTQISPVDHIILHYWGKQQKILMDQLIYNLLNQNPIPEWRNAALIRSITKKWKKELEIDAILQEAVFAFCRYNLYYGIKKVIQLGFRRPGALFLISRLIYAAKKDPDKIE